MEGIVCVTYRCNAHCQMCNIWKYPTKVSEEIVADDLLSLPKMESLNITGGEPFLRDDISDIIKILEPKSKRIVISTNGFLTNRILEIAQTFPNLGYRISLEGLPAVNDRIRGLKDGFDHGLRTILKLRQAGVKDVGFGITVSDENALDLLELYELADAMDVEFATAIVHNTYYFHKFNNTIEKPEAVIEEFNKLISRLLKSNKIKNWYRAYFNYGIINYIMGKQRLLPCNMGTDVFFIDPFGELRPCNGMEETMGNIKQHPFNDLWKSPEAKAIRSKVKTCDMECWMIGSVSPAMRKKFWNVSKWVLKNKFQ